jgi:hypothetical protein
MIDNRQVGSHSFPSNNINSVGNEQKNNVFDSDNSPQLQIREVTPNTNENIPLFLDFLQV